MQIKSIGADTAGLFNLLETMNDQASLRYRRTGPHNN
jgi:hypothetical protein